MTCEWMQIVPIFTADKSQIWVCISVFGVFWRLTDKRGQSWIFEFQPEVRRVASSLDSQHSAASSIRLSFCLALCFAVCLSLVASSLLSFATCCHGNHSLFFGQVVVLQFLRVPPLLHQCTHPCSLSHTHIIIISNNTSPPAFIYLHKHTHTHTNTHTPALTSLSAFKFPDYPECHWPENHQRRSEEKEERGHTVIGGGASENPSPSSEAPPLWGRAVSSSFFVFTLCWNLGGFMQEIWKQRAFILKYGPQLILLNCSVQFKVFGFSQLV